MTVVVQDASTLLNLLASGLLTHCVESLGLHILTTSLVAHEVVSQKNELDDAVSKNWVEIRTPSMEDLLKLHVEVTQRKAKGLTLQDVSAVDLARTMRCPIFSSDNLLRKYAKSFDLDVRGELWILDKLVEQSHITPAIAIEKITIMLDVCKARLPRKEVEIRITRWTAQLQT